MPPTFWLSDGSSVQCDPEDAPRGGIVVIKWFHRDYDRWFRLFGFDFYWFDSDEGMWYGAPCECAARQYRDRGHLVIAGKQCRWDRFDQIMQESK